MCVCMCVCVCACVCVCVCVCVCMCVHVCVCMRVCNTCSYHIKAPVFGTTDHSSDDFTGTSLVTLLMVIHTHALNIHTHVQ